MDQNLSYDECRMMAFNGNQRIRLNSLHLSQIRQWGEFRVVHPVNPAISQHWRVARWFHSGYVNLFKTYRESMIRGLEQFTKFIPQRVLGYSEGTPKVSVSLRNTAVSFIETVKYLTNLFIGLPQEKNGEDKDKNPCYTKGRVQIIHKLSTPSGDQVHHLNLERFGWRISNFFIQGAYWSWDTIFSLIYSNLYKGRIGLGSIFRDDSLGIMSFIDSFKILGRTIQDSRSDFYKSKPEEGMFGGTISNILNMSYSYLLLLIVGTAINTIVHTIWGACAVTLISINTLVSLALAVTSPIWVGIALNLIVQLWDWLFLDKLIEGYFPLFRILLWNLLICTILRGLASILGIAFHFAGGLFLWAFMQLYIVIGGTWDLFSYGLILMFGKIPISDNFICTKISASKTCIPGN